MNIKFIKLLILGSLLSLLLCFGTARAQAQQSITPSQAMAFIKSADTVIFRFKPEPPPSRPADNVLIICNELTPLDWQERIYPQRTLFALKSNLLYDAASALNVELEVPIGERFSIAAEWIFPWWLSESRQRSFELLNGNVEGRYWFGDRSRYEQLTGWSAGVYFGGGYYDLEWDGTGYQGEHLLSGGVSGGYAHSIGRNLRLEYSLGLGFLYTKYRKYNAQKCSNNWLLVRERSGRASWFGPTRLRVSLSWMIMRADKRGGRR